MTIQQVTPWFDGTVKPEHVGVYERCLLPNTEMSFAYSYWNGKWWIGLEDTPEAAVKLAGSCYCNSRIQALDWRGTLEQQQ